MFFRSTSNASSGIATDGDSSEPQLSVTTGLSSQTDVNPHHKYPDWYDDVMSNNSGSSTPVADGRQLFVSTEESDMHEVSVIFGSLPERPKAAPTKRTAPESGSPGTIDSTHSAEDKSGARSHDATASTSDISDQAGSLDNVDSGLPPSVLPMTQYNAAVSLGSTAGDQHNEGPAPQWSGPGVQSVDYGRRALDNISDPDAIEKAAQKIAQALQRNPCCLPVRTAMDTAAKIEDGWFWLKLDQRKEMTAAWDVIIDKAREIMSTEEEEQTLRLASRSAWEDVQHRGWGTGAENSRRLWRS